MSLEVSLNSWHGRVYAWWYCHKYEWSPRESTNLCPYIRTVMFWAPTRAVLGDWVELWETPWRWSVTLNMLTIPLMLWGIPKLIGYESWIWKHYFWVGYLSLLGLGLIISSIVCFILGIEYGAEKIPIEFKKTVVVKSQKFGGLIEEWFKTFHDGICPRIKLTRE